MIKISIIFTSFILLLTLQASAKPLPLPKILEKEVISLIEDMGPDSWEEGDTDAKIDGVLYDQDKQTVYIAYRSRKLGSRDAYVKQKSISIEGIRWIDEIIDEASNGYRSLNEKIVNEILDTL